MHSENVLPAVTRPIMLAIKDTGSAILLESSVSKGGICDEFWQNEGWKAGCHFEECF
jgi:hypothetical protein